MIFHPNHHQICLTSFYNNGTRSTRTAATSKSIFPMTWNILYTFSLHSQIIPASHWKKNKKTLKRKKFAVFYNDTMIICIMGFHRVWSASGSGWGQKDNSISGLNYDLFFVSPKRQVSNCALFHGRHRFSQRFDISDTRNRGKKTNMDVTIPSVPTLGQGSVCWAWPTITELKLLGGNRTDSRARRHRMIWTVCVYPGYNNCNLRYYPNNHQNMLNSGDKMIKPQIIPVWGAAISRYSR